jgi:hypothetical protein
MPHTEQPTIGYRGLFPGGKARLGRDADHSSPSSVEIKNELELRLLFPVVPAWRLRNSFVLLWQHETR